MTSILHDNDIFFIWTHGEDKLKTFLENLNQFHPNIKSKHESKLPLFIFKC